MDATEFFVYTASFASIVILVLVSIAFYFFYKTLIRVQSFFQTAELMLHSLERAKVNTTLSAYRSLRSLLNFVKGGE